LALNLSMTSEVPRG